MKSNIKIVPILGVLIAFIVLLFGNNLVGRFLDYEEKNQLKKTNRTFKEVINEKNKIKENKSLNIKNGTINTFNNITIYDDEKTYSIYDYNSLILNKIETKTELTRDTKYMKLQTTPIETSYLRDTKLEFYVYFTDMEIIPNLLDFEVIILKSSEHLVYEDNFPIRKYLTKQAEKNTIPNVSISIDNNFEIGIYQLLYGFTTLRNRSKLYYQMAEIRIIE